MGDTIKLEKKPCPKCGQIATFDTIKSGERISTRVRCPNKNCGETVCLEIGSSHFYPYNPPKSGSEIGWSILRFLYYSFLIIIGLIIFFALISICK